MRSSPAVLSFAILIWSAAAVAAPQVSPKPASTSVCPVSGAVAVTFRMPLSASSFRAADGHEIKLAGVIGPGEDGEALTSEQAAAVRQALASAVAGHPLSMAVVGNADRYRQIPVQLFADSAWVQEAMVRQGLLRVSADQALGACAASLLAAENQAIAAMAGHWRDGLYRIRTPDQLASRRGHFEIVEAEVWRVRLLRGAAMVEFGNASNFQLSVPAPSVQEFRSTRFDIRRLRNRIIRARGWIGLDSQLSMEVTNPALIEIRDGTPIRRR